jgi:hypothetical protein
VHPDHLLWTFRPRRDFRDRDRACVRREDRAAAGGGVEIGKDLELEIPIFCRRFDDERRVGCRIEALRRRDTTEDRVFLRG